jgi:hypothetical protein
MQQQGSKIEALNVLFHGLWVFVCWPKYIHALAPCVPDHQYLAGARDTNDESRLGVGQNYSLVGVGNRKQNPTFDPNSNSIFEDLKDIDYRVVYCSILLPLPDDIHSLCCVKREPGKPFHVGRSVPKIEPSKLALVQALTYRNLTGTFGLSPCVPDLSWDLKPGGVFANLHLRAEPYQSRAKDCASCSATIPFERLNCLFPKLEAKLSSAYDDKWGEPMSPPPPQGIDPDDVSSQPAHSKRRDVRPINCHSPVIIQS